jgi:TorA maturation chaperone TorD
MTLNTLTLRERSDTYKLLSEGFYQPDERLLCMLNSMDNKSGELCSQFADNVPELDELDSLKLDHTKLFIGPYKMLAPPYGSVYLENRHKLMDDSTIDVLNIYGREGLDINLQDAPDHIIAELEFMYFLVFKEAEAIRNSELENAAVYHEKQESFWRAHLAMWVLDFAKNIEKHASTEFYKKLGILTRVFFSHEVEYFNSRPVALLHPLYKNTEMA